MADQFVGEIRIFPYTYAPYHWAYCYGQSIPINQNVLLYALLGTSYGGDGVTNFKLPDLSGRVPIHMGQGPGLTNRPLGQRTGLNSVTLTTDTMPSHNHNLICSTRGATKTSPVDSFLAVGAYELYSTKVNLSRDMAPGTITEEGGGEAHPNMMPYMGLNFCISLWGTFPPRT